MFDLPRRDLLRLTSDQEQDEAACREWWTTASDEDKSAVWDMIQWPYKDREMEIMSRLAQLAFTRLFLESQPSPEEETQR